jgi:hypothetical protein
MGGILKKNYQLLAIGTTLSVTDLKYPITILIDYWYSLQWNITYLNQGALLQKKMRFLPLFIRPLGLISQAFQIGILITFVNRFCFN